MKLQRILMAASAVALPLAAVVALAGPAAAGGVTGTGTVTCTESGSVSFSVPLVQDWQAASSEVVTTVTNLSGCHGGTPSNPTATVATKALKVKAIKCSQVPANEEQGTGACAAPGSSNTKVIPGCQQFTTVSIGKAFKTKNTWTGGPAVKTSKATLTVVQLLTDQVSHGDAGLELTGVESGSYPGNVTAKVYYNDSTFISCASGSGTLPGLTIDPAHSTVS